MAQRGVSRLVVNAFDGSNPFAYEEQVVDDSAPTGALESVIASMTRRLAVALDVTAAAARFNEAPKSENAG
jgi:hypothetical protein